MFCVYFILIVEVFILSNNMYVYRKEEENKDTNNESINIKNHIISDNIEIDVKETGIIEIESTKDTTKDPTKGKIINNKITNNDEKLEEIGPPNDKLEDIKFNDASNRYSKIKESIDKLRYYKYNKGVLKVVVGKGTNIAKMDKNDESDPFVKVSVPHNKDYKTKVIMNNQNPIWNESFEFKNIKDVISDCVIFDVFDKDKFTSDDFIGSAKVKIITVCQVLKIYVDI